MKKIKPVKIPIKRMKMKKELRLSIITLLALIMLASSYSAFAAHQSPTTIEQITPTYTYTQTANYDYKVYLKPNSLYTTSVIYPGEQTIFKKIIDTINASIDYSFNANQNAEISGSYSLTGQVQTSLWTKDFTIEPTKTFTSSSNKASFEINFPLNLTVYEDYITKVNEETGATAAEPKLLLLTKIKINAKTGNKTVKEEYNPTLEIPLNKNIVEFIGNLTTSKSGQLSKTIEIDQPEVESQQTIYTSSSAIFAVILILFVVLSKSEFNQEEKTLVELKKIKKKYGEWIVETTDLPIISQRLEKITVNSFDDLVKISEEIGRPIIYFTDETNQHSFYIIDNNLQYRYQITQ